MYQDRFRPLSPEEKKAQEEKHKEIIEAQKRVIETGQKCLANEDFRRYKEAYKKLEDIAIGALIEYANPDVNKYAFFISSVLNKLGVYRTFIALVDKDAKKVLPEITKEGG